MFVPHHLPALDLRGVYCLRTPVYGLWAYYALTSAGRTLCEPIPCEAGEQMACVVTALWTELDAADPIDQRPALSVIRGCGGPSASPASPAPSPRPEPGTLALVR